MHMKEKDNKPQVLFVSPQQVLRDMFLISAGSILCAIAINGILIRQNFVTGGVTGISLVVHKFLPSLPLGWTYLILNVPLFALAWMAVGRRFFFYSIFGALSLTLAIAFVHVSIDLEDKMLNALLAGLILGEGQGFA